MSYPILNLSLLEEVLEGIWSGSLDHNQTQFYCGTSACVAGWVVVLDSYGSYDTLQNHQLLNSFDLEQLATEDRLFYNTASHARMLLGLTKVESSLFFDMFANKELHVRVLERLRKGERISLEMGNVWIGIKDEVRWVDSSDISKHYHSGYIHDLVITAENHDSAQELADYLQIPVKYSYITSKSEVVTAENQPKARGFSNAHVANKKIIKQPVRVSV